MIKEKMNFFNFEPEVTAPEDKGRTSLQSADGAVKVVLYPGKDPVSETVLRFRFDTESIVSVLADAWGVAVGDLGWKAPENGKFMPWYFFAEAKDELYAFGVRTGCAAFCSWYISEGYITLRCDTRSGGEGVVLKDALTVCEVLSARLEKTGGAVRGDEKYAFCRSFCGMMCEKPNLPGRPMFGYNTWYNTYGDITRKSVLGFAADCAASCAGIDSYKPFMVIDDGWQASRIPKTDNGAPYAPNSDFGDMKKVAEDIAKTGCVPGIWIRPMLTLDELGEECFSKMPQPPAMGRFLDITSPGAREYIYSLVKGVADAGYGLIKHDFTSPDFMGKNFLKPELTVPGWTLFDRSVTNAQALMSLYRLIEEASGSAVIIGCNTFSHLAAGIHSAQRTGCDTSGRDWNVTKKNGINSLVYRLCQNGTFYTADPDCAAFTDKVPIELNLRYAELISRLGGVLFVSADHGILKGNDLERLNASFARCAAEQNAAVPLDWDKTSLPSEFLSEGEVLRFIWE